MHISEFKSVSSFFKQRVDKLEYKDLYPKINSEALKVVFETCDFWDNDEPDNFGPNWIYLNFISVNKSSSKLSIGIRWYADRLELFKFTSIKELATLSTSNKFEQVLFPKDIGVNHETFFIIFNKLILECINSNNA